MARIYATDGTILGMEPEEGHQLELEALQRVVGGAIETVWLPKDRQWLVCNEKGRIVGLPENREAMAIWARNFPDGLGVNDGLVLGDVVVCSPTEIGDGSRGLNALTDDLLSFVGSNEAGEEVDMDDLWDLLLRLHTALDQEGYGTDA